MWKIKSYCWPKMYINFVRTSHLVLHYNLSDLYIKYTCKVWGTVIWISFRVFLAVGYNSQDSEGKCFGCNAQEIIAFFLTYRSCILSYIWEQNHWNIDCWGPATIGLLPGKLVNFVFLSKPLQLATDWGLLVKSKHWGPFLHYWPTTKLSDSCHGILKIALNVLIYVGFHFLKPTVLQMLTSLLDLL